MQPRSSYSGYTRRRKTSRLVRVGEVLSRVLITLGGIGTIVAVATVCVFLVWVVVPLFQGATIGRPSNLPPPGRRDVPLLTGVDEYQLLRWAVFPDGTLEVSRLDNGHVLVTRPLFPGAKLTCCSAPSRDPDVAFGFADGTVRLGRISAVTRFVDPDAVPASLRELPAGEVAEFEQGVLTRTSEGQLRAQGIKVEFEEPIKPLEPVAVHRIDQSVRPTGPVISLLTADGKLRTTSVSTREDLLTGEIVKELTGGELALPARPGAGLPKYLLVSGVGDNVFLAWEDGHLVRVSTQDLEEPKVVEEVELLEKRSGLKLTALQFLIGKATLLVGDSSGRVRTWYRIKPADARTGDKSVLTAAHEFPGRGAAVTALAVSARDRLFAAGYADGGVGLYYATSEKHLADLMTERGQEVRTLALAPKADGLVAQTPESVWRWDVSEGHPEVTLRSVITPVWYEGYEKPEHVWQSTGGDDAVEVKFGLWPLIFGTLKATLYSLLIGVPLALLAAVYSSEFLHPSTRAVVKPTIEVMASLPSVVLGFLAALVLAPFVEKVVPAVLAGFFTVPLAFVLGGYGWQLLPEKLTLRLGRLRFVFMCAALPAGVATAAWAGPLLERLLFNGDVKSWLDGHAGGSTGGWLLLLLPICGLATAFFLGQVVNPRLRRWAASRSRPVNAAADLAKFLAAGLLAVGAALLLAAVLNGLGFDPRGSVVGTYVQRNALVVGFMMGFAIIPIIYTIADDALSAVPEHLRSASLGCGATPWQTAVRITIPTAMSGLFSAVMIGMGRAVGETMIVLMAAGNTAVLDINVFNGFRTLSANIAVELPEAVRNSTHYRVLFLAALTLFAMTFALNTVAEIIRQRFRKRAYQL
ncbi:MAG TPA: ABC transporter permease subunit [Gemmataceae bacterium]|nr:ABC transporter permease subunit [Gemmataceae bacterium]